MMGPGLFIAPLIALAGPQPAGGEATVSDFIAAYNARDFAAYEALMAPDIRLYSVDGATISLDGAGRETLLEWTRAYLSEGCPSCRSDLVSLSASGDYITTVERASWTTAEGTCRSQTSPAIYHIAAGALIEAVYYFPASDQTTCTD